mmetsp:Transcript_83331/g.174396  ORF Transcript_83331/g.174396 Transcript_83331/m.174396 type:complete len:137 (+) Transcript_83331:154-564(+)
MVSSSDSFSLASRACTTARCSSREMLEEVLGLAGAAAAAGSGDFCCTSAARAVGVEDVKAGRGGDDNLGIGGDIGNGAVEKPEVPEVGECAEFNVAVGADREVRRIGALNAAGCPCWVPVTDAVDLAMEFCCGGCC